MNRSGSIRCSSLVLRLPPDEGGPVGDHPDGYGGFGALGADGCRHPQVLPRDRLPQSGFGGAESQCAGYSGRAEGER